MATPEHKTNSEQIKRQRLRPRIWDYSYFLLKNNYNVFCKLLELIEYRDGQLQVLDVGCGFKPWAQMFDHKRVNYVGTDFDAESSSAEIIAPSNNIPVADSTYDVLIYSEVLEHVDDLPGTIAEMNRMAKPGALIFISTPFAFPEHGAPHDFQRLTRYYYAKQFGDQMVFFRESNSALATAFVGINLFIESTPLRLFVGLKHIVYILTNTLALMADWLIHLVFDRVGKKYKKYFFTLPLGFAMIVRIKK